MDGNEFMVPMNGKTDGMGIDGTNTRDITTVLELRVQPSPEKTADTEVF
jgi:hypothetical protein